MKAYNFKLLDQEGKVHKLSDYLGKWVVLYFYPEDDTPGCVEEACSFRDNLLKYKNVGAEIIGISKDSVSSHKLFADKFSLNFTLLSDPDKKTIKKFGAWGKKSFMGKEYEGTFRNTYLINPLGEIVKEYKSVDPTTHSEEILKDLETIQT